MNAISIQQLMPHEQRLERQCSKRIKLLTFLSQEIFTCSEIAGIVMGLQSRQATHKSLCQYEKEGLIRRETIELADSSKCTIWGITSHGLGWSFDPAKGLTGSKVFEPSRVSGAVLRHTLDVQYIRIIAERAGWSGWQTGDRLSKWGKDCKRPDAIACDKQNRLAAIEVERSFKSIKRYNVIVSEYLQLIKLGVVNRVIWVSPNEAFVDRLKTIITTIQEVSVAGQKVKIDPARHHVNLHFCSYKQFQTI